MHIECTKNSGKPYLRIVEGKYTNENGKVKIKKKILKNLGPLEKFDDGKPDFLKRFRESFKNGTLDICKEFDIEMKENSQKKILEFSPEDFILDSKNIGYLFLNKIYNDLGINQVLNRYKSDKKIEYDLNGLTKLLVFGRILDPQSKKKTFQSKDEYLFPLTSCEDEKTIYKVLDVLDTISIKIQNRMNTKIKNSDIGRDTELTYYDVTNYYFETMYGDEDLYKLDEHGNKILDEKGKPVIIEEGLRKKGVSKENRKNPIVQQGLLLDRNGLPVMYKLFPGNTQDKTSFKDILENNISDFSLGKIIIVADNGMNTQENKYLITNNSNGYIVSKSVKKSWTKLREWALDDNDYTNINTQGEVTFKYKSRINEITLECKNPDGTKSKKVIKEKEIIYWSKKHYEKELFENQKFIEYLESCKEHPDKLKDKQRKSQEFIKVIDLDKKTGEPIKTKKLVVLLDEKIEKYKETMGFYSIVSSEIKTSDTELINKYHGLSRIEDSFRIIKSDLEGRPVYVWKKEHINAHFLICFIALTIIRIIQYRILKLENKSTTNVDGWEQGITAQKLKDTLKNFKAERLPEDYFKISKINEEIRTIMKSINIDFDFKNYTLKEIKEFRKKINQM